MTPRLQGIDWQFHMLSLSAQDIAYGQVMNHQAGPLYLWPGDEPPGWPTMRMARWWTTRLAHYTYGQVMNHQAGPLYLWPGDEPPGWPTIPMARWWTTRLTHYTYGQVMNHQADPLYLWPGDEPPGWPAPLDVCCISGAVHWCWWVTTRPTLTRQWRWTAACCLRRQTSWR